MAKAIIGPTGCGGVGILWEDFPAMEERGGYSGPFDTMGQARSRAFVIATHYGAWLLDVEEVENINVYKAERGKRDNDQA